MTKYLTCYKTHKINVEIVVSITFKAYLYLIKQSQKLNIMTEKESQKAIAEMSNKLKWHDITIEYAGSGCRFNSTKTPYKFRYTNEEGEKRFRSAISPSIYYFLKWQFRENNCTNCDHGIILRSNYGSSVKTGCPECGGYYTKNPKF